MTIPREVRESVSWLDNAPARATEAEEPIECMLLRGASGGLQMISSDDEVLGRVYKQMESTLLSHPPKSDDSDKDWMHLCRLFAAVWSTNLNVSDHYRINFPKEVAEFGIFSLAPETELAFFVTGDVLEVWDRRKYDEYLQRVAPKRSEIYRRNYDELQQRASSTED